MACKMSFNSGIAHLFILSSTPIYWKLQRKLFADKETCVNRIKPAETCELYFL